MMDSRKFVNMALDYTKRTFSPYSKFSGERLIDYLKKSELKKELVDRLCSYFTTHSEFYISWEDLIEFYECSVDEVGLVGKEDRLENILLFLEEIGFLFPVIGTSNRWENGPLYSPLPHKFFLGWDTHTIEIAKEMYLKDTKRVIEKRNDLNDYKESTQCKESHHENKKSIEEIKAEFRKVTSKESIEEVAEEGDFTTEEVYQKGEEYKLKYNNLISENVGRYFFIMEQKKKAPLCKHIKEDGTRCQKKIWHKSRLCHQHRTIIPTQNI